VLVEELMLDVLARDAPSVTAPMIPSQAHGAEARNHPPPERTLFIR